MPIPEASAFFPPHEEHHFPATGGALFLVDPARVLEVGGEATPDSNLIHTLTRKAYAHDLYRKGALVPALGVEPTPFMVTVRSTATENAPLPLSHRLFSPGFVLGTETGDLLLCNVDRLRHWSPGQLPDGHEDHPLANLERPIHISPGWYSVTVVIGLLDSEDAAEEAPVCAFLLEPQPHPPRFTADLSIPLAF